MEKALKFVLKRLKEKSTWAGIIGFVTSVVGFTLAPELKQELTTLGATIAGVGLMFLSEGKDEDEGSQ